MVAIRSLISDFHQLSGDTAVEKHKNFRNFLKIAQESLNNQNQDEFFMGLQPKDNFQEIFRIDLLSNFKRNEELLEVLKSGNREHIGRLLKNFSFFSEIFLKIDATTLINDVLPNTSYIIRAKVVNRISKTIKNEELIEEYFFAIKDKYGIRLALVLLPGCSIELIKQIIDKYNPDLSPRHLFEIYKKDKNFLEHYFDFLKKHDETQINWKYPKILKYIMKKDVDFFWKLQNKYKFDFQSGKRTTEKLILSNKSYLKDGNKCLNSFHNNTLYKTIIKHDKLDDFVLSFYPEAPLEFLEVITCQYSLIYSILNFLSAEKKFEIIKNLFEKKYSKNILDYEASMTHDFLKIVPINFRIVIAKKLGATSDDYIYLLHPNESIPLIKQLLQNSSSCEERNKLIIELVKVLELSDDENIRLELMQFVYERYRNDTISITSFVTRICDANFVKELNEEELKAVYKLFGYIKSDSSTIWYRRKIFTIILTHLVKNKGNYDDYLLEYLKLSASEDFYFDLFENDFKTIEVLEKSIILLDKLKGNKKFHLKVAQQVLRHLFQHNLHNKAKIPFQKYEHLLNEVFNNVKNNFYDIALCVAYHIKNFRNNNLEKLFWREYNDKVSYMITWFLKRDVKQVEDNIEVVLSQQPNKINKHFLRGFKKYLTPTLKEKMLIYIKSNLSYDDFKSTNYLVRILSQIDSKEFLEITAPFMPNKLIDEIANKKEVQENIIYSLSDLDLDNKFELIKKVCVGDYLKFGLTPLYKTTYNTKQNDIFYFLNDLKDSPISLKKHPLFLARHLLPIKDAWNFIDYVEKNPSIKNVIFMKSIHLFIETPTQNNWGKVKQYFNTINENDSLILDFMIKMIKKIPSQFTKDYVQSVYGALKKSKRKGIEKKVVEFAKNIKIDESYRFLEEIIEIVLNDLLLKSQEWHTLWGLISNINPKKSNQLLCFTLEHIKTILQPPICGYSKHREPLTTLVSTFCIHILTKIEEITDEDKDRREELIKTLIFQWNFFPKYCLIESEMILKLTEAYFESNFDLEKFATPLDKLLHFYVDEYGLGVIQKLAGSVEYLFSIRRLEKEIGHGMVNKLLEINTDKINCIFAILFLPLYVFPLELNKHFKWVPVIKVIEKFIERNDKDARSVLLYYDIYLQRNRQEYFWIGNQEFPSVFTKV
ncbi:uncharacterized protein [Onthophagus taurus]|uniref:uncharacterized protein n=1 Tax=Onthophagus taurus TaxID=166361 RepID=UPI0039BDD219